MAKLPGYLKMTRLRVRDGAVMADISIRWWHPGAWLALLRGLLGWY